MDKSGRTRSFDARGAVRTLPVVLALALPAPTSAQATTQRQDDATARGSAQSDYEVAAKLGFDEFTLGNYIEARARFTEAHKLSPNARTLRALGMVEYELKRYVEATAYLQQALSSRERPLTSEQRAQTEQLLRQALGYVTRFRFALKPDNAGLTIDGVAVTQGSSRAVLLAAGEHVIEANAANHLPARRTVQVLGGEEDQQLTFVLVTQRTEPAGQAHAPPERREPTSSSSKKAWIWGTVAAVLVGGAVVGLIFGLRKDSNAGEVNNGTTGVVLTIPGMALERR